ncbi:SCAN domain-containing protein 3-like [Schistocerca nitens]|uniref:SCAN domain-containing protein 3-like n=1 Tax=Schistocerca nitens TaxID=7011 RepID=UPI002118B079|nr:SCAN domain-containing protein 3-like [Schistocerca nitens]
MSVMKKRKYNDYIKYGFASIQKNGVDQPQCVICYEVLNNDSMRPSRLERHLWEKHGALKEKLKEFFAVKCDNLKRMKLDTAGSFARTSEKVLEASYELSLLISRTKKSHIIEGTLVKPCLLKAADIVLGSESKQKLSQIPPSDNTKLIGVCTDGAPSMLGCHSGFVQMVRKKKPSVTAIHSVIHRQALAAKTLPKELDDVLKLCIKIKARCSCCIGLSVRYFESLNTLNLKLQGGESNIIFHRDAIKAFTDKLQLWKRKILACFPRLFGILEEARFQKDFKDTDTKSKISNHLQHLIDEFERYFPNSCDDKIYYRLATDPFHVDVDVLPDRLQEEVLEIKNDSAAKYDFEKMDKPLFWVKYLTVYPSTAEQALKLFYYSAKNSKSCKKYASSSFTLIFFFLAIYVCGNNIFIIITSHYKRTCYFPPNYPYM